MVHYSPKIRFSIIGSGPSGFYTAKYLLKKFAHCEITFLDAMPTPFGLVRFGVAPDHKDTKKVINEFSAILNDDRCNFLGNVKLGKDLHLDELRRHFDAVILAYGAAKDRKLNVSGEDLPQIFTARKFINWYNGTPNSPKFNLETHENALIIGNGNVALDCARIISGDYNTLKKTDITEDSLKIIKKSKIKNVFIMGRKGPLESKFSVAELREMFKVKGLKTIIDENSLNEYSKDEIDYFKEKRISRKKFDIFSAALRQQISPDINDSKGKALYFKFRWNLMKFEGEKSPKRFDKITAFFKHQKGEILKIDCGLVLNCTGFYSTPVDGIPFDKERNVLMNDKGRVIGEKGVYTSGWLKNGPSGMIINNIIDAKETVDRIEEDFVNETEIPKKRSGNESGLAYGTLRKELEGKKIEFVDKEGWMKIDREERRRGSLIGKEREKITDLGELVRVASNS